MLTILRYRWLGIYLAILIITMFNARLSPDSYYYWNWSEHLQLSYFDGSPLIAYVIRFYTFLFGQHEFSLYLIGLTTALVSTWLIFRTAEILFGRNAANITMPLWLLTPGVIRYYIFQITYNNLLIIFWALTLYFFVKIITNQNRKYFYYCGISMGCMLLSKYTGILLCVSLLIVCLSYKSYRFILKSRDFYCALLIAFLIFSPVLIWNYQHDWISFTFQLQHGFKGEQISVSQQLMHFILGNIIDFNVPFLLLIILGAIHCKKLFQPNYAVLTIPTLFVWLFFFVSSCFSMPQTNWSAPFYVTGVILLSQFLSMTKIKKYLLPAVILILCSISLVLILGNRFPALYPLKGPGWSGVYGMKTLMGKIEPEVLQDKLIFGDDYQLLSYAHYFFPGKPQVFSTTLNGHQYYFWWQKRKLQPFATNVLYISYQPVSSKDVEPLKNCKLLAKNKYIQNRLLHADYIWNLYIYSCNF